MKPIQIILAVLLVITTSVGARGFTTHGWGNYFCGQYLSAVHNLPPGHGSWIDRPSGRFVDDAAQYQHWLSGFISASNLWIYRAGVGKDVKADHAATDVWMRRWCEQNPTKTVFEAVYEFVREQCGC